MTFVRVAYFCLCRVKGVIDAAVLSRIEAVDILCCLIVYFSVFIKDAFTLIASHYDFTTGMPYLRTHVEADPCRESNLESPALETYPVTTRPHHSSNKLFIEDLC